MKNGGLVPILYGSRTPSFDLNIDYGLFFRGSSIPCIFFYINGLSILYTSFLFLIIFLSFTKKVKKKSQLLIRKLPNEKYLTVEI